MAEAVCAVAAGCKMERVQTQVGTSVTTFYQMLQVSPAVMVCIVFHGVHGLRYTLGSGNFLSRRFGDAALGSMQAHEKAGLSTGNWDMQGYAGYG